MRIETACYTFHANASVLSRAVALAAAVVACSEPPTKEHDQALRAPWMRHVLPAPRHVHARGNAEPPRQALAGYDAAVGQRDYRLALSLAIDARESAYAAARRAPPTRRRAPELKPSNWLRWFRRA